MRYKYVYLTLFVVALLLVFMRWNDYREKDLVDVLKAEEIEEILYSLDDGSLLDEKVKNQESIQEWINFLSHYRVKKEGPKNFTTKYPHEQFSFQLVYEDGRSTLPSLIEGDVLLLDHDQYTITNGPVDYDWIERFVSEQQS
ncbi:hypothetical protein [Bhargavaea ginsengi]|uniref:hypothetical protein n=1 Tax=Bhargavaea ginsengi TaxID=426757 RepID=UPI003C7398E1